MNSRTELIFVRNCPGNNPEKVYHTFSHDEKGIKLLDAHSSHGVNLKKKWSGKINEELFFVKQVKFGQIDGFHFIWSISSEKYHQIPCKIR